jgi:aryl-alcohol dehydrogenase-like predicted oxidoreductase
VSGPLTIERRSAPRLGREVTVIGWGAFKIGRNEGVKYPTPYDLPSEAEAAALIGEVIAMGIGAIDTAPAYGLSETRLGAALGLSRERIFLSSKAGENFESGRSTHDFSQAAVTASVRRSLERLRTPHLDLVWVHSDGGDEAILREGGALRALAAAREAGSVRAVGFSPKTLAGAMAALDDPRTDALMLEFHPRDASMLPAIERAGREGRAVFVKKPLASGHLAPAEAVPWILRHPEVTCVVVGGLNAARLRATAALASGPEPAQEPGRSNHR